MEGEMEKCVRCVMRMGARPNSYCVNCRRRVKKSEVGCGWGAPWIAEGQVTAKVIWLRS